MSFCGKRVRDTLKQDRLQSDGLNMQGSPMIARNKSVFHAQANVNGHSVTYQVQSLKTSVCQDSYVSHVQQTSNWLHPLEKAARLRG